MEHLTEVRLTFHQFFMSSNEQITAEFDSETKYKGSSTREYFNREKSSVITNIIEHILNRYVQKASYLRNYVTKKLVLVRPTQDRSEGS